MEQVKSIIKKYFPYKISSFGYFLFFLQLFYLYQIYVTADMGAMSISLKTLALAVLSMGTVFLAFQIISLIFSFSRKALVTANISVLFFYSLLVAYHFGAQELFNWSVFADNIGEAFSAESFSVIHSSLDKDVFWYFLLFSTIFLAFEAWKKTISKGKQTKPYVPKLIASVLVYIFIVLLPIDSFDPFINFFRSVIHYYNSPVKINLQKDKFIALNNGQSFNNITIPHHQKPHVFLIIVESLNTSALSKTNDQGHQITPFMNQLQNSAVYAANFYGNSIQTAKGHLAILFSIIPSITGKTFVKHQDLKLNSIASVFQKNNYNTTYFVAHHNPDFDNERDFLTKRGYNKFETIENYLEPQDNENKLRWGVEDTIFYQRFFQKYFDQQKFTKPQFFTLITIANHFPFKPIPKERRFIYKNPKNIPQDYANSIHLVDQGLKQFFQELKKRNLLEKSLVIITGDHAFPLGEHNTFHIEAGYHQESFQTPLFISWQDKLKPQIITKAHSQMDIAPTIIDLLSLKISQNNFQGTSIFSQKKSPAYLIQPYGKHLAVISYPYKYRYYDKTDQEYVYDLEKDPIETTNIIASLSAEKKEFFRKELKKIYYNQHLIQNNLFWPQ